MAGVAEGRHLRCMLVTIGREKRALDASDPVELLIACHLRIRRFTDLARRLSESARLPAAEVAESARTLQWFFGVALPLHAIDEDLSVAPRLLARTGALGVSREVEEAIAVQAAQHPMIDHLGLELAELVELVASSPTRLDEVRVGTADIADCLAQTWDMHLTMEEETIFPAIASLPLSERDAILGECKARRKP